MKDKANTDVNADAKNVYSFLEQDTEFPAIPTYPSIYISLGYSWVHLLPGDTSVTFLSARQPSSNFKPFLRVLSAIYSSWTWESTERGGQKDGGARDREWEKEGEREQDRGVSGISSNIRAVHSQAAL